MNTSMTIDGIENSVGMVPVGGEGRTLFVIGPGGVEATIALGNGDTVLLAKPNGASSNVVVGSRSQAAETVPETTSPEEKPARRRGRPPKAAQPETATQEETTDAPKKRRGRPPKAAQAEQEQPAKRGPGRPRKEAQPETTKPNGSGGNGVDTETGEITITDDMFLDALDVALGEDDVPVSTAQMAEALNAPLALVRAKARELDEAGAIVCTRVNRENRYTFPAE